MNQKMIRITQNKIKNNKIMKHIRRGLLISAVSLLLVSCGKAAEDNDEQAYRSYGITCMSQGNYEEAVKAFQKALSAAHSVGDMELDINLYLAESYYRLNDIDSALETYDALISYNDYAPAYFQRGNLLMEQGRTDEALSDYNQAIQKDKKNYELYIGIYETLKNKGQDERARDYLQKGYEQSGEKGRDHFYKGRIAYYLEEYENAVSLLKQAIEQDYVEANFYLAMIEKALGENEAAETYLNAYLSSDKVDAQALVHAGEETFANKDYEWSIRFFEGAKDQKDLLDRQNLLKNLTVAYEKMGDYQKAKEILEEYVNEFPKDDEAAAELQFLKTREGLQTEDTE